MIQRADITIELAIKSLRSATCPACGGAKQMRQSLCRKEYFKLPPAMRACLYARVGGGYEEALLDALRYLDADTFHAPPSNPQPSAD